MGLEPTDVLAVGTRVAVGNKQGTVIGVEWEKDQFGFPIAVHTIKYDKIFSHTKVVDGKRVSVYKPYNKVATTNYSFISLM